MNVDLVHVDTGDGLRLDGFLRRPATSDSSRFGVDVAICFHGVTGNFYQAGVFDEATDRLVDGGCSVLRREQPRPRPHKHGCLQQCWSFTIGGCL